MEREQILCDYRRADEDKRLSLFLTYRELRDEFTDIDQEIDSYHFRVPRVAGFQFFKAIFL